jgi:transposase
VRVNTAFNRILGIHGTVVDAVAFTDEGLVLTVRRRARTHRCPCGRRIRGRYDTSTRRWRHLDFGTCRVQLEAVICRLWCPRCRRVRTEDVPWARPGARFTRDFEDMIAWLAQRMDKTSVARLLRTSWESVDRAITRVVADHLDTARLDALYRIGVDEISYRKGRKFLTVVADHDTGHVVWVTPGKSQASLARFFDLLGPQRAAQLQAVTMDGSKAFRGATANAAPNAAICLDPFHIIKWASEALDAVFRAERFEFLTRANLAARSNAPWATARFALRRAKENLTPGDLAMLAAMRRERVAVHRAWLLKEELRDLFRTITPAKAGAYLKRWIARARRCGITPMVNLAKRLETHTDRILAGIELGLSNSRLEGINAKIRVIQRRGYGYHHPEALAASIYLCCGGLTIQLPTQR